MEQVRFILALTLSFLVLFIWEVYYVQQYPQDPEQTNQTSILPNEKDSKLVTEQPTVAPPVTDTLPQSTEQPVRTFWVKSPFYEIEFSELGATFNSVILKNFKESIDPDSLAKKLFGFQNNSGSLKLGMLNNQIADLNKAVFKSDFYGDILDVSDVTKLAFQWTSKDGISVSKTFTFSPQSYMISLSVSVTNQSSTTINDQLTLSLLFPNPKEVGYIFEGPSSYIDKSLHQIAISDIKTNTKNISGKVTWVAIEDRYFMTSVIPKETNTSQCNFLLSDDIINAVYVSPKVSIPNMKEYHWDFDLFFGPKELDLLTDLNQDLSQIIDFGWFDVIAKPCLKLMNLMYQVIPNYGIAIILLTLLIKILLWPLGNMSYKSMKEMKRIQPLVVEIRERYSKDVKKMNEELMKLYKLYKVNPFSGCLPILLQIPVFIALYRMLSQAIELRHAPFVGWITDLSAPDRLFDFQFAIPFMQAPYGIPVLTVIMGVTMFIQQKMSPPPGDPTQAKMMMFLPIFFTAIFINFPAGLVLYWLINNVASILQQYHINKKND